MSGKPTALHLIGQNKDRRRDSQISQLQDLVTGQNRALQAVIEMIGDNLDKFRDGSHKEEVKKYWLQIQEMKKQLEEIKKNNAGKPVVQPGAPSQPQKS